MLVSSKLAVSVACRLLELDQGHAPNTCMNYESDVHVHVATKTAYAACC
jgi:hypothetical protein